MRLHHLGRSLWLQFHGHRPSLICFQLSFLLISLSLLSPASLALANALIGLQGMPAVGNNELLSFALSPLGLLWLVISGSLAALLIFLQHAGTLYICQQNSSLSRAKPWQTSFNALHQLLKQARPLLKLALSLVSLHLASLLVWGLPLIALYHHLLGHYDLYFVVQLGPDNSRLFLSLALPWLILAGLWHLWLYQACYLSLACCQLEGHAPWAAIARSWRLRRGRSKKMLTAIISLALISLSLPILNTLSFQWLGSLSFELFGQHYWALQTALLLLTLCYLSMALVLSLAGTCFNGLLMFNLHRVLTGRAQCPSQRAEAHAAGKLLFAELLLLLVAGLQLIWLWPDAPSETKPQIVAHRGSSLAAPENSMSAIQLAIEQGSDWIELDVRATRDQQLVLLHDRDLLRLAGERRAVWQMTLAELQQLDLGSWFSPEFAGEPIVTLEQAVAALNGRALLYLEIKPAAASPELPQLVVDELRRLDFMDQTLIISLYPAVLEEVRQLAPEARTGLIVHSMVGDFLRLDVDVLAVRAAIASPLLLSQARSQGKELHVWTVNEAEQMANFIDLGVDAIITDDPKLLAELLEQRAELSPAMRRLLAWRFWLW